VIARRGRIETNSNLRPRYVLRYASGYSTTR
jgi:hypothetical protein